MQERSSNMNTIITPRPASIFAFCLISVGMLTGTSARATDLGPSPRAWQSDAETLGRVKAALASDNAVESWEFDVNVEGGVVTLQGRVDSQAEKRLAADIAKDVPGVRYVRNRLHVTRPRYQRDAFDVAAEIEGLFRADPRVDAALIRVTVDGGEVRLAGDIASRLEKRAARSIAQSVAGVESVRTNELQVRKWLQYDTDAWYPNRSDREVEASVRLSIESHPHIQVRDLLVDVDGDVAVLSGTVRDLTAKRAAGREAQSSREIRRVENHIEVQPVQRSDGKIMRDISRAIKNDQDLNSQQISVNVYDRTAYLSGHVASRDARRRAEEVASRAKGLVGITNMLTQGRREYDRLSRHPTLRRSPVDGR
jgi:osmotically-inducible protein OsmY